jgi:hypothetical protein
MQTIPNFAPKMKGYAEMKEESEVIDSNEQIDTEKRVVN